MTCTIQQPNSMFYSMDLGLVQKYYNKRKLKNFKHSTAIVKENWHSLIKIFTKPEIKRRGALTHRFS